MTIEKRLANVEASVKMIAEYVKQHTEKIEKEFGSFKSEVDTVKSEELLGAGGVQEELTELKRRFDSFVTVPVKKDEHLETRMGKIEETMGKLHDVSADKVEKKLERTLGTMRSEFDDFRREISPKLHYIDGRLDKLKDTVEEVHGHIDSNELKGKLEGMDRKLHQALAMKEHIEDIEKTLEGTKEAAKKVREYEEKIAAREEKDYGKLHEELESKVKNLMGQVEKYYAHSRDVKTDLDNIRNEVDRKMKHQHESKGEISDLKRIADDLTHAREMIEKELVNRVSLEKRVRQVEDEFAAIGTKAERKYADDMEKHIKEIEAQVEKVNTINEKKIAEYYEKHAPKAHNIDEKKIEEYTEKHTPKAHIDEKKIAEYFEKYAPKTPVHHDKNYEEEITDTRHTLEAETAKRLSLEKRLHEMETEMKDYHKKLEGINNIEEIANMGAKLHDMEKNMKMMSVRLLTQQLNEFAKNMDRKIPNIVSKEEYKREIADLNHRLKNVEAPDLAPLGYRVDRLEKQLTEVAGMIRGLHNRVPVVVE